jgi:hypothetical protein
VEFINTAFHEFFLFNNETKFSASSATALQQKNTQYVAVMTFLSEVSLNATKP